MTKNTTANLIDTFRGAGYLAELDGTQVRVYLNRRMTSGTTNCDQPQVERIARGSGAAVVYSHARGCFFAR